MNMDAEMARIFAAFLAKPNAPADRSDEEAQPVEPQPVSQRDPS